MKMKKQVSMISMKKRAIAFLMAFAMVMSLLPGTAGWAGEVENSSGDVSGDVSGDPSGDVSGDPSGDVSGDAHKEIQVTAEDVNVLYDGAKHGIEVEVTKPTEGVTVKYRGEEGEYNLVKSPEYSNAGEYTVYYQVEAVGYETKTGSATIKISPINQSNVQVEMSDYTYGGTVSEPRIVGAAESPQEVKFYYNTENSNKGGTEWKDIGAESLQMGLYYMYAVYGATTNYNSGTTVAEEFRVKGKIEATAEDVNVSYNGQKHGIEVNVTKPIEGAVIKYGTAEGEYNLNESPQYSNAGEYTVYYQVEVAGCEIETGSAKVKINPIDQSDVYVEMSDYTYGETVGVPSIGGVREKPEVTYFYNKKDNNGSGTEWEEWKEWKDIGPDSLSMGTYCMYAVYEKTTNYNGGRTVPKDFQVNGKELQVTAESIVKTYDGQKYGIEVKVTEPIEGAAVKYGTAEGEYNLNESPGYSNAGEYTVYYQVTAENYNTVNGSETVKIEKAAQDDTTVAMKNYERGGKSIPSINKPVDIKEGAVITFYYNTTGDTGNGTLWVDNNSSKIVAGNYYIYAVLGETTNYKEYRTKAVGFTVYAGHFLGKGVVTKKRTDSSEGELTYTCEHNCGYTKKLPLPKKVVTVELGKMAKIIRDASACKIKPLSNASKYKKYLTLDTKKGKIKTKKYYKVKLKKSIPVNVVVDGETYKVNVKIKIPAPKVKIIKKKIVTGGGEKAYRYTFKYDIKGADKIKVRMKRGGSKQINAHLDKFIKTPKSNKNSLIQFSNKTLKKLKNKVTFQIVAHYGKNKSETLTITK